MIRWNKSDLVELRKAVNNFNRKIKRLEKEGKKGILPEKVSYSDLKENILFRSDLNRTINSLRRFTKRGAEDLYVTQSGVKMTRWERRELGISARTTAAKITREINRLKRAEVSVGGIKTGQTKASMGRSEINELEARKKAYTNIENRTKQQIKWLKERYENYTISSDYKKRVMYKENYLLALTNNFKNMRGFSELWNELVKINPTVFYEYIRNDEVAVDISFFYDIASQQFAFNRIILAWEEVLGIKIYDTANIE